MNGAGEQALEILIGEKLNGMETVLREEAIEALTPTDEAIEEAVERRVRRMHKEIDEARERIQEEMEEGMQPTEDAIEQYIDHRKEQITEGLRRRFEE